jgi:hypothetical protein
VQQLDAADSVASIPLLSDDWPLFVTSQKPIGDVGRLLPIAA